MLLQVGLKFYYVCYKRYWLNTFNVSNYYMKFFLISIKYVKTINWLNVFIVIILNIYHKIIENLLFILSGQKYNLCMKDIHTFFFAWKYFVTGYKFGKKVAKVWYIRGQSITSKHNLLSFHRYYICDNKEERWNNKEWYDKYIEILLVMQIDPNM